MLLMGYLRNFGSSSTFTISMFDWISTLEEGDSEDLFLFYCDKPSAEIILDWLSILARRSSSTLAATLDIFSSLYFLCFVIIALNLFLIECSVRLSFSTFTSFDHFLP